MRTSKITTALAVTVLIVAVLGATPLGHAAGGLLPRNSVGTPQVKKAAITSGKLKAGAVTGTKVLDGSLTPADFKAGSLPAGPKGDTGPSDAYVSNGAAAQIGTGWTEIAKLSLPPAEYVVTAKLYVQTFVPNSPPTVVVCTLGVGKAGGVTSYDYSQGTVSANLVAPVLVAPMSFALAYSGADTTSLYCKSPIAAAASSIRIVATKVGALHQ